MSARHVLTSAILASALGALTGCGEAPSSAPETTSAAPSPRDAGVPKSAPAPSRPEGVAKPAPRFETSWSRSTAEQPVHLAKIATKEAELKAATLNMLGLMQVPDKGSGLSDTARALNEVTRHSVELDNLLRMHGRPPSAHVLVQGLVREQGAKDAYAHTLLELKRAPSSVPRAAP